MSSDSISLNLNDLDDDLLEAANDFELITGGQHIQFEVGDEFSAANPHITLESILNEEDDLENDEILRSLGDSLTLMRHANSSSQQADDLSSDTSNFLEATNSLNNIAQQYQTLSDKNGIVCKQAPLKQISAQLIVAIDRSDAGLPTALAVAQLFAVGTSRGLILLFDSQQILKLYITTEYKDAITALALNNT